MRINKEEEHTRCRDGLLICKSCGSGLCHIPTDITEFKFAVICGCGALTTFEGKQGTLFEGGAALVCKNDHYKCPECSRVVFGINRRFVTNVAFKVRCSCGRAYDKSVDYGEERRLGALPYSEEE